MLVPASIKERSLVDFFHTRTDFSGNDTIVHIDKSFALPSLLQLHCITGNDLDFTPAQEEMKGQDCHHSLQQSPRFQERILKIIVGLVGFAHEYQEPRPFRAHHVGQSNKRSECKLVNSSSKTIPKKMCSPQYLTQITQALAKKQK